MTNRVGMSRRLFLLSSTLPLCAAIASELEVFTSARAMKIVVPFPPGGGGDISGRIASQAVGNRFGNPVIVENRGGAGGSLGADIVSRAAPDGNTLLLASTETHSLYPHIYPNHRFRANEFVAVTPVAKSSYVLVGKPELNVNSLAELAALSKQRQLSYSSYGVGSSVHLNMFELCRKLDMQQFLHVPYQGAAPAVLAVASGEVDLAITPMPTARAQSKLVRLGVLSAERSSHLPEVPTLREQGVELVSELWMGLLAPPGTPADIAKRLANGYLPAMSAQEVQDRVTASGQDPFLLTQAEFADYLVQESKRWGEIAKVANIQLE